VFDLMREFRAEVVGIGVLIETAVPKEKLINRYISLIEFAGTSDSGEVLVSPSQWVQTG